MVSFQEVQTRSRELTRMAEERGRAGDRAGQARANRDRARLFRSYYNQEARLAAQRGDTQEANRFSRRARRQDINAGKFEDKASQLRRDRLKDERETRALEQGREDRLSPRTRTILEQRRQGLNPQEEERKAQRAQRIAQRERFLSSGTSTQTASVSPELLSQGNFMSTEGEVFSYSAPETVGGSQARKRPDIPIIRALGTTAGTGSFFGSRASSPPRLDLTPEQMQSREPFAFTPAYGYQTTQGPVAVTIQTSYSEDLAQSTRKAENILNLGGRIAGRGIQSTPIGAAVSGFDIGTGGRLQRGLRTRREYFATQAAPYVRDDPLRNSEFQYRSRQRAQRIEQGIQESKAAGVILPPLQDPFIRSRAAKFASGVSQVPADFVARPLTKSIQTGQAAVIGFAAGAGTGALLGRASLGNAIQASRFIAPVGYTALGTYVAVAPESAGRNINQLAAGGVGFAAGARVTGVGVRVVGEGQTRTTLGPLRYNPNTGQFVGQASQTTPVKVQAFGRTIQTNRVGLFNVRGAESLAAQRGTFYIAGQGGTQTTLVGQQPYSFFGGRVTGTTQPISVSTTSTFRGILDPQARVLEAQTGTGRFFTSSISNPRYQTRIGGTTRDVRVVLTESFTPKGVTRGAGTVDTTSVKYNVNQAIGFTRPPYAESLLVQRGNIGLNTGVVTKGSVGASTSQSAIQQGPLIKGVVVSEPTRAFPLLAKQGIVTTPRSPLGKLGQVGGTTKPVSIRGAKTTSQAVGSTPGFSTRIAPLLGGATFPVTYPTITPRIILPLGQTETQTRETGTTVINPFVRDTQPFTTTRTGPQSLLLPQTGTRIGAPTDQEITPRVTPIPDTTYDTFTPQRQTPIVPPTITPIVPPTTTTPPPPPPPIIPGLGFPFLFGIPTRGRNQFSPGRGRSFRYAPDLRSLFSGATGPKPTGPLLGLRQRPIERRTRRKRRKRQ